jgi:hypothetical protein
VTSAASLPVGHMSPKSRGIVHSGGSQRGSRAGRFTAPEAVVANGRIVALTAPDIHRCERSREDRSGHVPGHGQLRFLADVRGELAGPAPVIDT